MNRAARCLLVLGALLLFGCSDETKIHRTLKQVGPATLRAEAIAVCRPHFNNPRGEKIPPDAWPASVRAFEPLSLWAEPDGAYLLLDSDSAGERGIYLPRIASDKDPVCTPALNHVKLAENVYWYDRKRN